MKNKNIQTKRQVKSGLRKLHARVSSRTGRRQRVTASNTLLDSDVPNPSVGRALTLILILHLVAVGVIFVGFKWNKGDFDVVSESNVTDTASLSDQNKKLKAKIMHAGDTYAIFAKRHNVDVDELRRLNDNVLPNAGRTLLLPPEIVTVVSEPKIKKNENLATASSSANVSNEEVESTENEVSVPRAVIVGLDRNEASSNVNSYKVQAGDSVWRISNRFQVSQEELMKINGMSDPRQLRSGATIKIPIKK